MTPGRRSLRFHSFDEIVPDVERLVDGHSTVGNWSLAQICRHLADVLRLTVDLPAGAVSTDPAQAGELADAKRRAFESGQIPEGMAGPPSLIPPDGLDLIAEERGLREAIVHYAASPGPAIDHPFFGPLTKEEWDQAHLIHCAHHLSFAVPDES